MLIIFNKKGFNSFWLVFIFCAIFIFVSPIILRAQSSSVNINLTVIGTSTPTYTITSSAGPNGTITNSLVVLSGGSATFNITPNPLYEISSLVVDSVGQATSTTYTFNNVISNHTIEALFDLIPITTTPTSTPTSTPPNPPSGGGGGGGPSYFIPLTITKMAVSTAEESANLSWSTNNSALLIFSWGLTSDYESGSISDIVFSASHQVKLQNLTPATHYYFKISGHDQFGQNVNYTGDFYTLSLPNLITLPNVSDLEILPQPSSSLSVPSSLFVSWQNPPVSEFAGAVVVRSPYGYPRDANDGKIIYDGTGDNVVDTTVQKDTVYYYSVFVYDSQKHFSSGAIANASLITKKIGGKTTTIVSTSTPASPVSPTFTLKLSDVDFIQDGRSITYSGDLVPVFLDKNLTVSVSLSKIPAKVDLGILKVTNPYTLHTNKYLFLFNAPRKAYESQVNLYGVGGGIYPFALDLQFANNQEGVLSANFVVTKASLSALQAPFWQTFYGIVWIILILIILILLLIIVVFGIWRLFRRGI